MIAIDTNVVLRLLVGDDAAQTSRAQDLIRNNDVLISLTVILETALVLRTRYGFANDQIAKALLAVGGLERVSIDSADSFRRALAGFAGGLDFADALHLAQARDPEGFATFDRKLARIGGRLTDVPIRLL